MTNLSDNAKKLLKHFEDSGIDQGVFEFPATQEELFDDVEDCEKAQDELEGLGLLELAPLPPFRAAKSPVAPAALTLEGARDLNKPYQMARQRR